MNHHHDDDDAALQRVKPSRSVHRSMVVIVALAVLAAIVTAALLWPRSEPTPMAPGQTPSGSSPISASGPTEPGSEAGEGSSMELVTAVVTSVRDGGQTPDEGFGFVEEADPRRSAVIEARVPSQDDLVVTAIIQPAVADAGVSEGDRVKLYRHTVVSEDGVGADKRTTYAFADFDRTGVTLFLLCAFGVALLAVAGFRGLRAMLGLAGSGVLLWAFTFPALLSGSSPLLVALSTGTLILTAVLYLTHGVSLRTTTALLGTLAGMVLAAAVIAAVGPLAHLTGITSEESIQLWGSAPHLSMSQMVVCAVIITAIGVLNDVTITQASAVWEMRASSARATARELFTRGMRVGRDHVSSSVYTVAFAVVGAGLGTYLMLRAYDRPMSQVFPLEQFSGEIITTVIGLGAVLLAMPLTTLLAVTVVSPAAGAQIIEPAAPVELENQEDS